jgi:exodeoxyribonuclease VII large subunit
MSNSPDPAPPAESAATPAEAPGAEAERDPAAHLPGPYGVGDYARGLREWMRGRPRLRLIGEVAGLSRSKVQAYFELRDAEGAVPCSMWLSDLERLELPDGALRDGAEVVVAGGPDYYPGGGQSSPSFSFRTTHLRLAGEGDLLARLEALRNQLRSEGLFQLQPQLPRPRLPKTIGVVTAERGAARRDLLAGLERRGWRGTVIWGFAPVQDRHAAPAIGNALRDLAARPEVEVIVVTRGGGSLADLWAFCDESLCRTVAMLRVPVISAVGHERDSTLIDDVAAAACSTPTHAAEAAVPLDCNEARASLVRCGGSLRRAGEGAVAVRASHLATLARGPERALQRQRRDLNQTTRELRAASERGVELRREYQRRLAMVVLQRAARRGAESVASARGANSRTAGSLDRAGAGAVRRRREAIDSLAVAIRAHDPKGTLDRGYVLAQDSSGEPVTDVAAARKAGRLDLQFADGEVAADVREQNGERDG